MDVKVIARGAGWKVNLKKARREAAFWSREQMTPLSWPFSMATPPLLEFENCNCYPRLYSYYIITTVQPSSTIILKQRTTPDLAHLFLSLYIISKYAIVKMMGKAKHQNTIFVNNALLPALQQQNIQKKAPVGQLLSSNNLEKINSKEYIYSGATILQTRYC